jgi:hypothetical protein
VTVHPAVPRTASPRRTARARSVQVTRVGASPGSAVISIAVVIATGTSPRRNRIASMRCTTTPAGDQRSISWAVPTCAPPSQIA